MKDYTNFLFAPELDDILDGGPGGNGGTGSNVTKLLKFATGKVTVVHVQEIGRGFGPKSDNINIDATIKISSKPNNNFGFTLRRDKNQIAHESMLKLCIDAFHYDTKVTIEYTKVSNRSNFMLHQELLLT